MPAKILRDVDIVDVLLDVVAAAGNFQNRMTGKVVEENMKMLWREMFGSAAVTVMLAATIAIAAEEPLGDQFFDVTRDGRPVAVLVAPDDAAAVWEDAIALVTATIQRWSGVAPMVVRQKHDRPLPDGQLIIIGTPQTSDFIALRCRQVESPLSRVPFVDRHGFAVETTAEANTRRLVLAAPTPRGAYNAAVYCRDFLLDTKPSASGIADVFVRSASVVRSPRLAARGTYHLSLYGTAMKYTAEDWMKIIDRYAEDGMNRVYFWLSGHHPSKKFPQLYNVDSAKGTRLTVEGVGRLIKYCHDRDIEFHIGGGVFAWTASHYLIEGHPEIAAVGAAGLCPSQAFARSANREHFLEMYDTWPDADGFMFEVRDEHGPCHCANCDHVIDGFGSKGCRNN